MPRLYNTSYKCDLGWNRCSKGTPITKKAPPLPLIKGGTTKEEEKKQKS
jgi:hypothetical protein